MSLTFDVATVLGIGTPNPEPIQERDGYVTLRVPEGISPRSLRESMIGKGLIWQDDWYAEYSWANESLPPGVYHLRLLIPNSNRKTLDEQKALLLEGEEVAPVALLELALLCMQKTGLADPLNGDLVRCQETADDSDRVALHWRGGRLSVRSYWNYNRHDHVWSVGARKVA